MGLYTGMYYRSMRSTTPVVKRTSILEPAYVVMAALLFSLLISAAAVCYEFYVRYLKTKMCQTLKSKQLALPDNLLTIESINPHDNTKSTK